jgi:carboxylate-amine ligase
VDESVLLATLIRALVMTALHDGSQGPTLEPEVLRAAYWLAARDGITGNGLDVRSAEPIPMTEMIERLRQYAEPALQELGDAEWVEEALQRVMTTGNGAVRQRKAFREGANLIALTEVKP